MISSYEVVNRNYWQIPLIVFTICCVVIFYLISLLQQSSRSWKMGLKIPGPNPLPIFGNALMMLKLSSAGIL